MEIWACLQRVLKQYVVKLHGRLPRTQSGVSTMQPQAGTTDWQVRQSSLNTMHNIWYNSLCRSSGKIVLPLLVNSCTLVLSLLLGADYIGAKQAVYTCIARDATSSSLEA